MSFSPASVQFDQYGTPILTVSGTDGVRIGVNTTISGAIPLPTGASQEHTDAGSPHSVRLTDGSSFYKATTPADTQPVSVASLPLPTGAATEATLASIAAEDFATETTLASVLSELQQKTEPTDTQPISAVSLPLPVGAATSSLQNTGNTSLASIDQKFPLLGQGTLASGIPVSIASDQTAIPVTDNAGSLTVDASSWPLPTGAATETTSSGINYTLIDIRDNQGIKKIQDALPVGDNAIGKVKITDGTNDVDVFDDSGILRLRVEAKLTAGGASQTVDQGLPASGTNAWPVLDYDKESGTFGDITSNGARKVAQVIRLVGTNFTEDPDPLDWDVSLAGSGSIDSVDGLLVIDTGATADSSASIESVTSASFVPGQNNLFGCGVRVGDTGVTNNVRRWGAFDVNNGFFFQLSGTTFAVVVRNAGVDTVITSFNGTAPAALNTNFRTYSIAYTAGIVQFYIGRSRIHSYVATTTSTAATLSLPIRAENINSGGLAQSSQLIVRGISISRLGELDTTNIQDNIPDSTVAQIVRAVIAGKNTAGDYVNATFDTQGRLIIAPAGASSSLSGFSFGDVTLSSTNIAVVRRTAYNEQSTNAQRSISSSNANDTSAGTGARQVKITYFDSTGAGPFTETVTMNGTSAVNTVATDICFIEDLEVVSVGSTGSNVGIITLFVSTAGGGGTIGTIAATNNQTFWSHHYVPTGKTCFITSFSASHSGTTVGSGGVYILRARAIGLSTDVDKQVSDFVRQYGQASNTVRNYGTPIEVVGPARIVAYCTPEGSGTVVYRAAFDFYEQDS